MRTWFQVGKADCINFAKDARPGLSRVYSLRVQPDRYLLKNLVGVVVEHTEGQERTFSGLSDEVDRKLGKDYVVDRGIPHVVKVSRRLEPNRETILNFAGEILFIHYEQGEPASLPQPVRVEEDGTLLEMRTNLPLSNEEIVSGIRKFLAA